MQIRSNYLIVYTAVLKNGSHRIENVENSRNRPISTVDEIRELEQETKEYHQNCDDVSLDSGDYVTKVVITNIIKLPIV